jgi:hypothetical protein
MTNAACESDHSQSCTPCLVSVMHDRHAAYHSLSLRDCAEICSELGLEQYQIHKDDHRVDLREAVYAIILLLVITAEMVALSALVIPSLESSHTAPLAGFLARTAGSFVGR